MALPASSAKSTETSTWSPSTRAPVSATTVGSSNV
jgi:hypothetical protein